MKYYNIIHSYLIITPIFEELFIIYFYLYFLRRIKHFEILNTIFSTYNNNKTFIVKLLKHTSHFNIHNFCLRNNHRKNL